MPKLSCTDLEQQWGKSKKQGMFPKVPVDEYCHFNKKKETRKKIKHKKKKEGKATKKKEECNECTIFRNFFPVLQNFNPFLSHRNVFR